MSAGSQQKTKVIPALCLNHYFNDKKPNYGFGQEQLIRYARIEMV
jgi:hypothetical protein